MKQFLKGSLAFATAISMAACTQGSKKQSEKISGDFTGTSAGMQGDVSVTLHIDKGQITGVDLTECHETESIASVAMERIPSEIVEHQTTDLDVVTGATFASRAIMSAASKAAESAGLDMEILKGNAYHKTAGKDETYDTDVAVVGGGGAGLSAAISAAQNGAKVILVEKSSFLGGDTMMAGGAFNAVDTQAQAERILTVAQKHTLDDYLSQNPEDESLHLNEFPEWKEVLMNLQADIQSFYSTNEGKVEGVDLPGYDSIYLHMWQIYIGGLRQLNDGTWICSNKDLAQKLAETALEAYDWTGDLGIDTASHSGAGDKLYTVLGAMWPRTHQYQNGKPLIDALKKAAEDLGVTIYTETAGTKLIEKDNRIVGLEATKADGTLVHINTSKGVILASGGYCANPAMVKQYDQYWGDDLTDHTLTTNVGTVTGDGIVMAQDVGAQTTGLGVAQLMPSSSPSKGTMTDGVWGDASEQIWIDGEGNRFVDEYAERDVLAKASLKLDDGIFYIFYAGQVKDGVNGMCQGASLDDMAMGKKIKDLVDHGDIWYGSTLKELAEATKTPAAGASPNFTEEKLREMIEKYNSYVASQNDPEFGKEVLAGAIDIDAIENNPDVGFIISPRKASLHHTMGGVVINTEAEVLNAEGQKIEGLWAAGEVTGGVHGGNRLGGNAIADIFTFGRIAGENAAK